MQAGHSLRESNQGLELSDRVPVRGVGTGSVLVRLSKLLVLIFEDLGRVSCELRLQSATHLDVGLELLHAEVRVQGCILKSVHVDDMPGDVEVIIVFFLVKNDKEQVKSGHNGRRDVHVVPQ